MTARERLARNLPGWLVDVIKEGFASFASDAYREPSNKTEAICWNQLLNKGYTVLKRGWPDFMVITNEDDLFVVEVKARADEVRPAQRVVLEALARKGIDTYIWWGTGEVETIGASRPPETHMPGWSLLEEMVLDES